MLQYTEYTPNALSEKKAVSLSKEGELFVQTNDKAHGVCVSSVLIAETNTYENVIYVAGGDGAEATLGDTWEGKLTRVIFLGGYAYPVATGGDGWIVPEPLSEPKEKDSLVRVVLYR
jgi:hypothetical protein